MYFFYTKAAPFSLSLLVAVRSLVPPPPSFLTRQRAPRGRPARPRALRSRRQRGHLSPPLPPPPTTTTATKAHSCLSLFPPRSARPRPQTAISSPPSTARVFRCNAGRKNGSGTSRKGKGREKEMWKPFLLLLLQPQQGRRQRSSLARKRPTPPRLRAPSRSTKRR